MQLCTIKKGRHRSDFSRIWPHIGATSVSCEVNFNPNCKYDLDSHDQMDINKLFGLSFGWHHRNSARFGWRWDLQDNFIEILAYVYIDGTRVNEFSADIHIGYVKPGEWNKYSLELQNGYYNFAVYNSKRKTTVSKRIEAGHTRKWGYRLYPYFGGNQRAPHTMNIEFSERI